MTEGLLKFSLSVDYLGWEFRINPFEDRYRLVTRPYGGDPEVDCVGSLEECVAKAQSLANYFERKNRERSKS